MIHFQPKSELGCEHPDPDSKKTQGCQKLDTKETCHEDDIVTGAVSANQKQGSSLSTKERQRCGQLTNERPSCDTDTESKHRVIRHGRNINVIVIKNINLTFTSTLTFNIPYSFTFMTYEKNTIAIHNIFQCF